MPAFAIADAVAARHIKMITVATALFALGATASLAQTGEVDADFSKYCREAFANSAYQKRNQPWGVEHYCFQGGTPQGIDMAEACRLTTGSRRFRVDGSRVLCAPGGEGQKTAEAALTTEDLVRYCRKRFTNGSYEKRADAAGVAHYCRRPGASGGFSLQTVNLSEACRLAKGTASFRKSGAQVVCRNPGATAGPTTKGSGRRPADRRASTARPDPSTRTENGQAGKSFRRTGASGLEGLWRMTINSIRPDLKVRFSFKGNQVIGTIVEIPSGRVAQAVRTMDGLKVGQPFLYGRVSGGTLEGTMRIGLMAASQAMTNRGNIRCKGFVADIERNPAKWMPFTLKRSGDRLKGRHRIVGLTLKGRNRCVTFPLPDFAPRVWGGYAILEMIRIAPKS